MAYDTSIKEAAAQLGVSPQAVHKRIAAGTLDARKVNKHWLVDSDSLSEAKLNPPMPGRPSRTREYLLHSGPYPVMRFTYNVATGSFAVLEVLDANRAPVGTVTRGQKGAASALRTWWEHRCIPESRAGMDAKLRALGVSEPSQIPFRNLGLSLSDQYWILPEGESIEWGQVNYFDNAFAGTSETTNAEWDGWLSEVGFESPDNTSEGVLPKCWLCDGGNRLLMKGHVPGNDQQPFNEAVATALHARLLDVDEFVPYRVVQRMGDVGAVSICPCFITREEEYVTAAAVLESEGQRRGEPVYDALLRHARNFGIRREEAERKLSKIIVCDSIVANSDRHLRNFGFIRNIHTLEWRFAPLFDSGNSLWFDKDESAVARGDHSFVSRPFDGVPNRQLYLAGAMDWLDEASLTGFVEEAVAILEDSQAAMWRLDYIRSGIEERVQCVRGMR